MDDLLLVAQHPHTEVRTERRRSAEDREPAELRTEAHLHGRAGRETRATTVSVSRKRAFGSPPIHSLNFRKQPPALQLTAVPLPNVRSVP
ncbi:MAG: hypothetical protein ACK595_04670 [Planctomycetota bacterium]